KVKNGDDLEAIKKASETLSEAAQKIGEKLYAAAQAANEQPTTDNSQQGSGTSDSEGAKDAEVDDSAPAGEEEKK
ncbi:MAG: molecular chaperone DnaK, partial [Candidatus Moranbacteria bacterium]|nr:molecular chaperone DnaK [Candidatus Moranbacteria bacterium]